MKPNTRRLRRYTGYAVLVACVLAAIWLVMNRQYVVDQLAVWQYKPTAAVKSLAQESSMSTKGTFLFYASQPKIDGTQTFNQYCQKSEPQSAILGCYVNLQIYIYDVKDSRLDGVEEVTAAHEMLHAAWDRLSDSEQVRVAKLLEATYEKLNNEDLNKRMEYYARTEPSERDNELHSILGTEYKDLGPELERYYGQYFEDRDKVVGLHEKYAAVFEAIQSKGKELADRLTGLASDINRRITAYNADVASLNADIQDFNRRAKAGDFSSRAQFDNERDGLLARSRALEADRQAINTKIKEYQSVRKQLEAINSQAEALNRSINSSLAPAPSVDG
jgi:hypothetical protein